MNIGDPDQTPLSTGLREYGRILSSQGNLGPLTAF